MKTSALATSNIGCALPLKEIEARWGSVGEAIAKNVYIVIEVPGTICFSLLPLQGVSEDNTVGIPQSALTAMNSPDDVTWRPA